MRIAYPQPRSSMNLAEIFFSRLADHSRSGYVSQLMHAYVFRLQIIKLAPIEIAVAVEGRRNFRDLDAKCYHPLLRRQYSLRRSAWKFPSDSNRIVKETINISDRSNGKGSGAISQGQCYPCWNGLGVARQCAPPIRMKAHFGSDSIKTNAAGDRI